MKHRRLKANKAYSRIDHFLVESMPDMSRSQIVKLIKEGRIQLNEQPLLKKNHEIAVGDVVDVELPEPEQKEEYIPSFQLTKLFEDDYLLVIDKPCGVSIHPGSGEHAETILDVFRYNYPQVNTIETRGEERPGIVHRLDKDTSGVLVLAKDIVTMRRLQKQFKRREVHKTYLAFVAGHIRFRNGTIDAPIGRCPRHRTKFRVVETGDDGNAREAVTEYSVIRQYRDFCYLKVFPLTGRTHQIRVHLSHQGNPVLGDTVYGKGHTFERLALHAYCIEFRHPITGTIIQAYSTFPGVFRQYLKSLSLKDTSK